MTRRADHETEVELKRHAPAAIEHHRVAVHIDLEDLAKRYGPRAAASISGKVRLLEGAVVIEKLAPLDEC